MHWLALVPDFDLIRCYSTSQRTAFLSRPLSRPSQPELVLFMCSWEQVDLSAVVPIESVQELRKHHTQDVLEVPNLGPWQER